MKAQQIAPAKEMWGQAAGAYSSITLRTGFARGKHKGLGSRTNDG